MQESTPTHYAMYRVAKPTSNIQAADRPERAQQTGRMIYLRSAPTPQSRRLLELSERASFIMDEFHASYNYTGKSDYLSICG